MSGPEIHIAFKEHIPQLPPIILLHGLTSAKESWDGCAVEIAKRTGTKVYALDARNHGDSGWSAEIGYDVQADDVARFMDSMNIPSAIIVGHSMGGKTGMNFGVKYPQRLDALIIEDISLHSSKGSRAFVNIYMQQLKESLKAIPPDTELMEAKKMVVAFLSGKSSNTTRNESKRKVWDGSDLSLRQKKGGGFEWKTNLDIIMDSMEKGKWTPVSSEGKYEGPVLIIYGTKSPFKVGGMEEASRLHFYQNMSRKDSHRITFRSMQTIQIPKNSYFTNEMAESLQYFWMSIPDPFLITEDFDELVVGLREGTLLRYVTGIKKSYMEILKLPVNSTRQPRSLKHMSRCALRKKLFSALHLPNKVDLHVPKDIYEYLTFSDLDDMF